MANSADQAFRSIRTLNDASALAEKRKELQNFRQRDMIDWTLNREFYKNNQWSYWNKAWPNGGRLENEPVDEGDKPHYKVRLTNNLILPGVQHYVAQLTKNRPVVHASPNTGSDRDLKSAQVGEALYEYWWQDMNLLTKTHSALVHSALSQGYWFISWDGLAGKQMNFMVDPSGKPLVGAPDEAIDIYREELEQLAEQQGLDPQQILQEMSRTVNVGDISVKVLPGENVILDPTVSSFDDAQYAIVIVNMDPDEVRARYKKAPPGLGADAVPGDEMLNLSGMPQRDLRNQTVRRVYHLYVRPGSASPKGRYVCWIEGPDMILENGDWPFPFTELPLVKFPGVERPDSALDIPVTTPARPLQKDINRTISQVVEHKNLTLKSQLLAPTGSIQGKWTNEPGAIRFFNPINGAVPQWREIPQLPSYVREHLADLERRIDMLYNRMPSSRDSLPARIDSGSSIDLLQETVADQISPTIQRLEQALVRAATLMVKLAQKYYIEPRMLRIIGANGGVKINKFMGSDLEGGFSFHAEAGSGLPRTRAGKQARIEFMLTNQLIDQRTAMKYLDTADMTGLLSKLQAAEEQAYRTIEKMKQGQPVNVLALQQAQAQIQQMMVDPTADVNGDGQPDAPEQKQAAAQQMLMQAAVAPADYEDPQVHIDVLMHFMTSVEFEALPPQIQAAFNARLDAMFQRSFQLAQFSAQMGAPVERPRVNLQIKSTASAPVAGEILRDSGVQVQDEQVAAPPLDTWVTDSLDKPNQSGSGDSPLDQASAVQAMQQSEDQHALKTAKAAHEVSLAAHHTHAAETSHVSGAQAAGHAEALHQMKMAQEAEKLRALRVKTIQARKPKATSK